MLKFFQATDTSDLKARIEALDRSQAVIEFAMDGTILTANANFLAAMGYSLPEIQGRHHSMFVEPGTKDSVAYQDFWASLRRGEHQVAQYKRLGKGGREVWIEASYNPIFDAAGKACKVVKYATDVTSSKLEYADLLGQVNAIKKSQLVIEFAMDGTILWANDKFLAGIGYELAEIQGKHHSIFVEPGYAASTEYRDFWASLGQGTYQAAQYRRLAKGGRPVWIEASYNPILDLNGKPFKVVKYATDITAQVELLTSLSTLMTDVDKAIVESNTQSEGAARAADETSSNVQMVATSAEELDASIHEILAGMARSRSTTDGAYQQALAADRSTQRLTEAARAMGGIIALIQGIASQINLLALNATIEAARAGDAGRGFAVVATEVKNLANQAAGATTQIAQEIENVQGVAHEVVDSLSVIRTSIESIREYVTETGASVEQQSAVTRSVSTNMQHAAVAVATITSNVVQISAAVHQAGHAIEKTRAAAQVLSKAS